MKWNIEVGQKFGYADIDLDILEKQVALEMEKGMSGYDNTYNGLAAERYLIENCSYVNDTRPYKDLWSENLESVEVKTFSEYRDDWEGYIESVLNDLVVRKNNYKYDISDYVIFFSRRDKEYTCHSMYEYNYSEKKFKKV